MRIELLEEQWVEMRPHMTLPMRDAFNECAKATTAAVDPVNEPTPDMEEAERGLVLASLIRWSYGPLDMATMVNEVPLEDQEKLGIEAVKVVLQSPLAERALAKNGAPEAKTSSRRSSAAGRSRRNSRSPTSAP